MLALRGVKIGRMAQTTRLPCCSLKLHSEHMNQYDPTIVARCRELGVDQHGLVSITNFVKAAQHHIALPGTLPADKHLAIDNAVRRATNRIACQGRHGDSRVMSRVLSRGAIDLREAILNDPTIEPAKKLWRWRSLVTDEHQDPVREIETRWNSEPTLTADAIVGWLLKYPSVIVLREEERRIPSRYRNAGSPAERYAAAGIVVEEVEQGTAEFFAQGRARRVRKGLYYVEREPFEAV